MESENKLNKKNLYIFPNLNGFKLGAFIFFSFVASIFYQPKRLILQTHKLDRYI